MQMKIEIPLKIISHSYLKKNYSSTYFFVDL